MYPVLLKVGGTILLCTVAALFMWLRDNKRPPLNQIMSNGNFDGSSTNTCYVCLQDFTIFEKNLLPLPCKHKFHRECIKLVFQEVSSQKTCPACRREIPNSFVSEVSLM